MLVLGHSGTAVPGLDVSKPLQEASSHIMEAVQRAAVSRCFVSKQPFRSVPSPVCHRAGEINGVRSVSVTFSLLGSSFSLVFTTAPIVLAVVSSCLIGIAFGYLPARNASRLDPVAALA